MTDTSLSATMGRTRAHLFSPTVDFLCLGGGGIVVMAAIALMLPGAADIATVAAVSLVVANFVNHPHFAHSYQIFYRGFGRRLCDSSLPTVLRLRYGFAGIVVPILIAAYMAATILSGDALALGYALNFMGFVVGWHYVKQGFGIAMVDAAMARRYYAPGTRRAMLVNGYAGWIYAWLAVNRAVAAHDLWGIKNAAFALGDTVAVVAGAIFAATSAFVLLRLAGDRWRHGRHFAVNGLIAYFVSLYAWVVFVRIDPIFIYVVPAMHSLQYLTVVWRFEANRERAKAGTAAQRQAPGNGPRARLAAFGFMGLVLGAVGFWVLPLTLDMAVPYDHAIFGTHLFLFAFWIFINVHHYFMDNVIWRRENPEAKAFLFS
ncbi:hypothetical protein L2U69_18840 [Zavarzinia compransoris]|uniref:hypothetical protein n=1 Tax=Zavarzinia marina TaxID=2911065 RepID=UPI001F212013|nr:hypothetical protein [Zavarzinia marina]MCF4167710.1 hypothetical protein [Zavarzinia marina]